MIDTKEILIKDLENKFKIIIDELKDKNCTDFNLTSTHSYDNSFSLTANAVLTNDYSINIGISLRDNKIKKEAEFNYYKLHKVDIWVDVLKTDDDKLKLFFNYNQINKEVFIVSNNTKEEEYYKLNNYLDDLILNQGIGRDGYGRNFIFTQEAVDYISNIADFNNIVFYKK